MQSVAASPDISTAAAPPTTEPIIDRRGYAVVPELEASSPEASPIRSTSLRRFAISCSCWPTTRPKKRSHGGAVEILFVAVGVWPSSVDVPGGCAPRQRSRRSSRGEKTHFRGRADRGTGVRSGERVGPPGVPRRIAIGNRDKSLRRRALTHTSDHKMRWCT